VADPDILSIAVAIACANGAVGRGSSKYPCHHDDIGRPSGGQQPRDLLGVPAVATVQEATQGSMRPMALIHISQAASIDRP